MAPLNRISEFVNTPAEKEKEKSNFETLADPSFQLSNEDEQLFWVAVYWRDIAGYFGLTYNQLALNYNSPQTCRLENFNPRGQGRNRTKHVRLLSSIKRINNHWPHDFWRRLSNKGIPLPATPAISFTERLARLAADYTFERFVDAATMAISLARDGPRGGPPALTLKNLSEIEKHLKQEPRGPSVDEEEDEEQAEDSSSEDFEYDRDLRKHESGNYVSKLDLRKHKPHHHRNDTQESPDTSPASSSTVSSIPPSRTLVDICSKLPPMKNSEPEALIACRKLEHEIYASRVDYEEVRKACMDLTKERDSCQEKLSAMKRKIKGQLSNIDLVISNASEQGEALIQLEGSQTKFDCLSGNLTRMLKNRDEKKTRYEEKKLEWEELRSWWTRRE